MIDLKFQIGDKYFSVEPQRDITAYESAQLMKLLLVSVHSLTPNNHRVDFINEHGLLRHFKEITQ